MKFSIYKKYILSIAYVLSFAVFAFAQTDREKEIELYQQGKNKEAVSVLEKASKQNKSDAQIWNFLGLAYTKEEELKKAVKAFEKAVSFEPQNANYRTNLAYAYFLNNKLDKAQSESTKAVEINPQNALAFYIRGAAHNWEGDFDGAISDADKAITVNADYSPAYVLKSDALLSNFGKRVGGGAKPFDEANLLQQSKDVLETCLKNCRNNTQTKLQQERLETLTVFYNYFSKNRNAGLIQTSVDLSIQTPAVPSAPDPNNTPLKILSKKSPDYTDNARRNSIEGTIRMAVFFSESGRVTYTLILKGLGGGLNESAVNAARQIKFEPAKKDGKPISQIKIIEYSFDIY